MMPASFSGITKSMFNYCVWFETERFDVGGNRGNASCEQIGRLKTLISLKLIPLLMADLYRALKTHEGLKPSE